MSGEVERGDRGSRVGMEYRSAAVGDESFKSSRLSEWMLTFHLGEGWSL